MFQVPGGLLGNRQTTIHKTQDLLEKPLSSEELRVKTAAQYTVKSTESQDKTFGFCSLVS